MDLTAAAVVGYGEVFFAEAANRTALMVLHRDVDLDGAGLHFERDSVLREQQSSGEKDRQYG